MMISFRRKNCLGKCRKSCRSFITSIPKSFLYWHNPILTIKPWLSFEITGSSFSQPPIQQLVPWHRYSISSHNTRMRRISFVLRLWQLRLRLVVIFLTTSSCLCHILTPSAVKHYDCEHITICFELNVSSTESALSQISSCLYHNARVSVSRVSSDPPRSIVHFNALELGRILLCPSRNLSSAWMGRWCLKSPFLRAQTYSSAFVHPTSIRMFGERMSANGNQNVGSKVYHNQCRMPTSLVFTPICRLLLASLVFLLGSNRLLIEWRSMAVVDLACKSQSYIVFCPSLK